MRPPVLRDTCFLAVRVQRRTLHRERPDLSRTRALLRTVHDLKLVGRSSDLDFEADLYDLFGQHTEIGGR